MTASHLILLFCVALFLQEINRQAGRLDRTCSREKGRRRFHLRSRRDGPAQVSGGHVTSRREPRAGFFHRKVLGGRSYGGTRAARAREQAAHAETRSYFFSVWTPCTQLSVAFCRSQPARTDAHFHVTLGWFVKSPNLLTKTQSLTPKKQCSHQENSSPPPESHSPGSSEGSDAGQTPHRGAEASQGGTGQGCGQSPVAQQSSLSWFYLSAEL